MTSKVPKQLSWTAAIVQVLRDANEAMHYTDIAQAIVTQKLRTDLGATPAATVSSTITTEIKRNPEHGFFRRTNPGEYIINIATTIASPQLPVNMTPEIAVFSGAPDDSATIASAGSSAEASSVKALGMFWRRDRIKWTPVPKILGAQQLGATPVDFSAQLGVYLLHDGSRTVYVGRVTERPLGKRLFEHTLDRLNGRWDRFSWFGLLTVNNDATLSLPATNVLSPQQIIFDLEAVLIEALEPPLNRKRGDSLNGVEYIQIEDPSFRQDQLKKEIDALFPRNL